MNRHSQSPSQQSRSVDKKRGVFTSYPNTNNNEQKPYVSPYLDASIQGLKQGLDSLKNLNSSLEAQSQKKVPPIQINVTAPVQGQEFRHIGNTATTGSFQNITHSHSNINHNNTSTNLSQHHLNINHTLHHPQNPNPKVQFHYQANQPPLLTPTYQNLTNIQYLPIVDNSQYSRQPVQIMRTVIPYQVTNQIPAKIVVNANSTTAQHLNVSNIKNSDQPYEILLREYQKLYGKLSEESNRVFELEDQLKKLVNQNKSPNNNNNNANLENSPDHDNTYLEPNPSNNNQRRFINQKRQKTTKKINFDKFKTQLLRRSKMALQKQISHRKSGVNSQLRGILQKSKEQIKRNPKYNTTTFTRQTALNLLGGLV